MFSINLQYGACQHIDMRAPDALRESFRTACLASCYFGGGLIKVENWLPGMTLRVALGEGPWLPDLPNSDDVMRHLNSAADAFDRVWHVVDEDIRTWLTSPREAAVHEVSGLGQTSVCWTDRRVCVEAPAMIWYACWPGMSSLKRPAGSSKSEAQSREASQAHVESKIRRDLT